MGEEARQAAQQAAAEAQETEAGTADETGTGEQDAANADGGPSGEGAPEGGQAADAAGTGEGSDGTPESGDDAGKGGDPARALALERKKRRAVAQENQELRSRLETMLADKDRSRPDEGGGDQGPTGDELLDADSVRDIIRKDREQLQREFAEQASRQRTVDRTLQLVDTYDIYQDEEVGGIARDALEARLVRATNAEQWEEIVERTASDASRMKVAAAAAREKGGDGKTRTPPPPTAGAAEAARMDLKEAPKNADEASQSARRLVGGIAASVKAKLGI